MKMKKIASIMMIVFVLCTSMVFADNTEGESQLIEAAWNVVRALLWVGYAVALGMVVYIGIKYITGAADTKANMKSAVVSYLIGALIVFSATTIATIVIRIATDDDTKQNSLAQTIIKNANDAASSE